MDFRTRGAGFNPANRFERIDYVRDEDAGEEETSPRTELLIDATRTIISRNDSPDVPFETSVNPYRGCEHGCIYCFARPFHEYLGFSSGLDFETRLLVKKNAAVLLKQELAKASWTPRVLVMSGVTDPYQPVERKLGITRGCLEVLAECRNPVALITKSHLVTRDADVLSELARHDAAHATVSITTLDAEVARAMEPRAAAPSLRLDAIARLSQAGVPTAVSVAPVVPGLTDHELPAIVAAAAKAGACSAFYVPLRLPYAVKDLFQEWAARKFPDRLNKMLNQLRALRGGKLYDSAWGIRGRGTGPWAEHLAKLFAFSCRKAGLPKKSRALSVSAFRRPRGPQLELF